MLRKDKMLLWLLPLLAGGFLLGIAHLFELRFEAGDIYPPYSSFRTDPLGTKAFYESLRHLPGLAAQRFLRPLPRLPDGRDRTLFFFGLDTDLSDLTEDEFHRLERFMIDGGRLVFSFLPVNTKPWSVRFEERQDQKRKDALKGKDERKADGRREDEFGRKRRRLSEEEERNGEKRLSLKDRWGVDFGYESLPKNETGDYESVVARRAASPALPASMKWHTALHFDHLNAGWNVIYRRDQHPVLIERNWGNGTLVLSADSYFLSNEAMWRERSAPLLAWLVGPGSSVLFDETHLGVVEEPGIAALIRKYRLHGLVLGILLLAALFVWKNAVSFVPPAAECMETTGAPMTGRDSTSGFVNLLRRSIAPSEVVSVCLAEWAKSCAHGRADLAAKVQGLAAVVAGEQPRAARERRPVEAYQAIGAMVRERRAGFQNSEFRVIDRNPPSAPKPAKES